MMAEPDGDNWQYARKICVHDARSLGLFHHNTYFRRLMVGIVEDRFFESIVLLLIVANSIALVMTDYDDENNDCKWN